jgi:DNA anti-recombination protein RmuC
MGYGRKLVCGLLLLVGFSSLYSQSSELVDLANLPAKVPSQAVWDKFREWCKTHSEQDSQLEEVAQRASKQMLDLSVNLDTLKRSLQEAQTNKSDLINSYQAEGLRLKTLNESLTSGLNDANEKLKTIEKSYLWQIDAWRSAAVAGGVGVILIGILAATLK